MHSGAPVAKPQHGDRSPTLRTAFRAPSPINGRIAEQRWRCDAPTSGDELPATRMDKHKSAAE
jgi:hypothetical protein